MFSTLVKVALFATLAVQGAVAFAVNNPELTQCGTAKITWQETKGPYNIIIVDAANPCGDALAEVGDFTRTWTDWNVTIPAGRLVQVSIVDADDDEAWSANITVGQGPSSCLKSSGSSTTTASGATNSASSGSGSDSGDGSSVDPLGAANAGTNPFNAAVSTAQLSKPAFAVVAFAALALAL